MAHSSQPPRNRLSGESSPYLLLHAANPVDWYPWGEDAFVRARREDKPIFLSVGYSTCYWCHVMERESFSDEAIARQLNAGFVSVKLDREERPDLDEIYMAATQLLTRSGGWPNSLFLTHDLRPFFAGTYFPPDDRHGRAGFPRVLAAVAEAWRDRRPEVLEQAAAVARAIHEHMAPALGAGHLPRPELIVAVRDALAQRFDPEWGGFGQAPKFPSPANLFLLLDLARAGDEESREMLLVTLDRMARGGLHDQLGGGFHRYSTDERWLVPHFEKMLYDNAALARLFAEAAALLPADLARDDGASRAEFGRVARATCEFVLREMTGEHGGFFSAIDAETDGHEGAYYTFTGDELRQVLDDTAWALLGPVYGFAGAANFEHERFVLHLPQSWAQHARARGCTVEELHARVEPGRRALLDLRAQRPRPLTDDKVLCDWNGLMIAALARVGSLLREPRYVEAAARAAEFVLASLRDEAGGLRHAWRAGRARVAAQLDDYAFLVDALIELHAADGAPRWLAEAVRLQREQDQRLWDEASGAYFTSTARAELLVRARTGHDGAVLSGNGVAATNLLTLAARTGERSWGLHAGRVVRAFGEAMQEFPLGHVTLARALGRLAVPPPEESAAAATDLAGQARAVVEAEASYDAAAPGRWKPARIDLHIRPGWHVNANPASLPFLVPTAVTGAGLRGMAYPPGGDLRSELAAEPLRVYAGSVSFEGELEVGEAGAPSVELTCQPCDAGRCLPAVMLTLTPRPRTA